MKLGNPKHESRALKAAQSLFETLPDVLPGMITHCSLHWARVQYGWGIMRRQVGDRIPYHAVADMDSSGNHLLIAGMSPILNARAIPAGAKPDIDYCAAVRGRDGHGAAICASAMFNATPTNFGDHPINEQFLEFICAGAAAVCVKYGIDPSSPKACYTHAEAAVWDGYFLGEDPDACWDLATLKAGPASVAELKAQVPLIGDHLRLHINAYRGKLLDKTTVKETDCPSCSRITCGAPH